MSPKAKSKGGAPSKYQKQYNKQAQELCMLGYTDIELAKFFSVSERTLNNWKKEHVGFMQSLKDGKDLADMNVVKSLYNRAVGYSHTETKVFNNQGEILTYDVKKIYPPDPISIKYWLNNRQPNRWREKVEMEGQEESVISRIQIEVVNANGNN